MDNVEEGKIEWFRCKLRAWAFQYLRDFPWRRTTEPYAIFIAEFLLQKTEASRASPIFEAFISRYPTLNALGIAQLEEVANILQPLGLFFRTQRLCQCVGIIVEQYQGKIPDTETQLLALPGVGKYTARSICTNAFGQSLAVLDTNVARILERFFGLQGNRVKSRCKMLWKAAEKVAPDTEVGKWNLTLLDFGAAVCTARNPHCGECPLQEKCIYKFQFDKNKRTSL
ncbi:A/G-specific adenine glycosylase [Plectonema radiosum NIES-515]|uniref:Adenine DNA glycosylase n=1 Tax=Plectonema radiosum NIES-515 TaxID=2986073 RepID=A0ABT3B6X0_9CYAN|nr:A/G-specific adenine glycosylase [Plectonema radiosum]MCV3217128.1 A/G-specific adenine glycosylase [Plectonema radiosum NIES-515]